MKKIATILTSAALVFLVTACEVSDEERAACEAAGNSVETDEFFTQEKGKRFWDTAVKSGELHYCASPQGHIMDVYNDEVTEVSHGLFGDSKDNIYVFEKCQEMEGITYETEDGDSESSTTKFVCVQDGRVLTFEHRD